MGGKQQGTGSNKKGMAHGTHNKSTWQYKTQTKAHGNTKHKQNHKINRQTKFGTHR